MHCTPLKLHSLKRTYPVAADATGGVRKTHAVNHVLWSGWPDKNIPATSTGAIQMMMRVRRYKSVVIHCSAGVGRTGTILCLDSAISALLQGEDVSVFNIVRKMRQQRYLACQTDLQYLYIHRCLVSFATSKKVRLFLGLATSSC